MDPSERRVTQLPVIITAFKRVDSTRRCLEVLQEVKPPRLYFACDGWRNEQEKDACLEVRALVDLVNWPCDLKTRFSPINRGSKWGMYEAVSWFFENESEGIILEDDILPAISFFPFCEQLLEHYRDDTRIWAINGNNLMPDWPRADQDSYWYNAHGYGAYWGWASWRRSWQRFDLEMKNWPAIRDSEVLDDYFLNAGEKRQATECFEACWNGTNATAWDFQFDFAKVKEGAVNIIPNVNLCRNIGFNDDGTHTVRKNDPRNKKELHEIGFPLRHPDAIAIDPKRDAVYYERYVRPPFFRRFKNRIKGMLPPEVDRAITNWLDQKQRMLGMR
jgi:hypothetical protein